MKYAGRLKGVVFHRYYQPGGRFPAPDQHKPFVASSVPVLPGCYRGYR